MMERETQTANIDICVCIYKKDIVHVCIYTLARFLLLLFCLFYFVLVTPF